MSKDEEETLPRVSEQTKQFLFEPHKHFVAGQWTSGVSKHSQQVVDPATETAIAEIPLGTSRDVDDAVSAARNAVNGEWRHFAPDARRKILADFAKLIAFNAEVLAEIETVECGTPKTWNFAAMAGGFPQIVQYYAGWIDKISGDTLPAQPFGRSEQKFSVLTKKEPIGVVGAITPWNSPTGILLMKIAPALAAGCSIVIKPPELAPLSSEYLIRLISEAGIPRGVVNLVHGEGAVVGHAIAAHQDIDKVSFTGSTETGRSVVNAATSNLKRVGLELGGKSPFVVFPDADLKEAVPAAAIACFSMSGQNCMAATRMFVHEKIYDQFIDEVANFSRALPIGNGLDAQTVIGPLISKTQLERVEKYIESAREEGARLVCGGRTLPGPGFWIEPTVFANCNTDMTIVREEIFGPVMSVLKFGDDLSALDSAINNTTFGLSGSVWTKEITTALKVADMIDSGQVAINAHAAISPETPFGGNRQSGWGRELGREGLEEYLKTKAVSIRYA